MLFGIAAFGDATFGGISGTDASIPNLYNLLLADPDADLLFLLVGQPKSVDDSTYVATTQNVYLSDKGFYTEPGDAPPSQPFPARLLNPFNFEAAIPFDGRIGRGSSAFGVIEIANADGELDALADYAWAGEPIEIKMGGRFNIGRANESRLTYPNFGRLFYGTAAGIAADRQSLRISLRDPAQRFAVPIQSTVYAGTGGKEGGSELVGRPKPLAYGVVRQVPPVLIDSANLVYQFHNGTVSAVSAVRDAGAALTFSADYASYALLVAAAIPAGQYATCLAEGMIRLGAKATALVTLDAQGDATDDGITSGYVQTVPAMVQRIAVTRGTSPLDYPADFETSAFASLPTQASGIWIGPEVRTMDSVLDELMASIGGWWTFTRSGLVTAGVLATPAAATDVIDLSTADADRIERLAAPEPVWRVTLGYKKFYATQEPSSLAASLTAAEVDSYGKQYRFVSSNAATGASILAAYPQARELVVFTTLDDATEAQAECDRLLALFGKRRKAWRVRDVRQLFQYRIGQSVRLEHDRFGLSAGVDYVAVGLAENAAARAADLTLWG